MKPISMIAGILVAPAVLVLSAGYSYKHTTTAHAAGAPGRETREALVLTLRERDHMLAGMRTYLESIQGIISSLATNQTKEVASHAERSGKKLLENVEPGLAFAVPVGFTSMSLDTHTKFDELADKARKGTSRIEIISDLSAILANCTTCHAAYRISPKR
jgi:hypothetical protein